MNLVKVCECGRYSVGQEYEPIGTGETFSVQVVERHNIIGSIITKVYSDAGFLIHYCGAKGHD